MKLKDKNCRLIIILVFSATISMALAHLAFAYPTIYPTGTTIYKPNESYNSYILIVEGHTLSNHPSADVRAKGELSTEVRLIDMNGNDVHTWKVSPSFNKRCRLRENGHLLHGDAKQKEIIEYDWEGNVVWRYQGLRTKNDLRWLPNDNRLVLTAEIVPKEYMKQVKDVETVWWGLRRRSKVRLIGDAIYEISPKKEIVWEWHAHEHLDLNKFSPVVPLSDWTHINTIAPLPENKWYDQGDKRFKPGNIIVNPRNLDIVYIIDKETKEVVWEWTHRYKGGLSHCHEPEMIEKGIPGEGNIILFDNALFPRDRRHCGQSMVIELDPVTKEIVWKYETEGYGSVKFFSKTMATQKRLPNGNTFISEDNTGRMFQVNPNGKIVWEYVNRTILNRPAPIPYDYCPQFKAFPKPSERPVTPPNNLEWHLQPDAG